MKKLFALLLLLPSLALGQVQFRATSPLFTTSVLTNSTSFNVFNTTATTVNAFGAASTALNIGNAAVAAAFPGGISVPTGKSVAIAGTGTLSVGGTSTLTGTVGIGTAPVTNQYLRIVGTTTGATSQRGISVGVTFDSGCTATCSVLGFGGVTEAVAFTAANLIGVDIFDATKGSGSSITNQIGIQVADQTKGSNNYGLKLAVSSGANKYNLYASGTAINILAGNTRVGGSTDPTVALDVTGAALISTTLGVTGHVTFEGVTSTGATGTGKLVFDTSPTFATSAISPLFRSTAAKVLLQGTGTGATQVSTTQTTAPTCATNCGTSPTITGTDSNGTVTMGGTGTPASGWVLTFNGTWAAAPSCMVIAGKAGMANTKMPVTVATTTTTMTVVTDGASPANSDIYHYHCFGNS